MSPRLVGIAGPRKGAVLTLAEGEFSIGREASNQLGLVDSAVSRRHCVITGESGRFRIHDLESHNGTFVNGVPVKERLLGHGDQVSIGHSVFTFLLDEGEAPAAATSVEFDEGSLASDSTVELLPAGLFDIQSEGPASGLAAARRSVRDLSALLKISVALSSVRGLDALQRKVLECIFEIVPADRGAILLVGENLDEFTSIFGWDRLPGGDRPVHVSRAAIDRALRERVAVLSNDVVPGTALVNASEAAKAAAEGTRALQGAKPTPAGALLAVPLIVFERIVGAIYLDTENPQIRFDENHLRLLTAIGGIAAVALENARRMEGLESENRRLHEEIDIEHNMVGESPRMKEVLQFVAKVAPTDSTVLIYGESGTGKELVARALHRNSPRVDKPFVAINCAALTETLLESEMFGHEKGAFTGAIAQKKGKLETAEGGTVFLDEIAELAPSLQAKLLRVLQEREVERVGGTRPIKIDVRLIAATNRNLEEEVRNKTFRQDLYYRLNVISLTLPPLRDRREDVPLLADYFAARYAEKSKRAVRGISPEARSCLVNYDWPGNIRELENAIERAVVLSSTDEILPEDLPESLLEAESPESPPIPRYHEAVKEAKRNLILRAIELARGNYTEAARALGVHPNYLHRLIRNMNLRSAFKKPTL